SDVSAIIGVIVGEPLRSIDATNADEVKTCVLQLHRAGLAFNDIHPGNFIRTPGGALRIIDLSCKANMKICQANDILALHRKYNINIASQGVTYNFIVLKEKFRQLSRKLRGK